MAAECSGSSRASWLASLRRMSHKSLALALLVAACASVPRAPVAASKETLFFNGRIYAGAPAWNHHEALLARDGVVVALGSLSEVEQHASRADRAYVDLRGGCAVPGLQDAHGHIEGLGQALETVDLRGCASYAELIERVVQRSRSTPEGQWIDGRGWDQNLWEGSEFPHHAQLSAALPRHPVLLSRVDGHAVLVNRRALELAGLDTAATKEDAVEGGRVLLDAEGKPTGVFIDAARALVARVLPKADDAARERRILLAQEHCLSVGLTAVHDMGVGRATLGVMERLRDEGRLELRLIEYLSDSGDVDGFAREAVALERDPQGLLRVAGVKLYADGALGSRGAALLEPYSDEPGNSGLMQITEDELARRVAAYASLGLQPATHAIGDRANRVVLDVYEAQARRNPRFAALRPRIEHAQIVAPSDWPRFAELGVVASMQPTHATSDMRWADERVGAERLAGAYAWRRLATDAAPLAFGSDFPVEEANPLLGLYAARTRQDARGMPPAGFTPDQKLDAASALAAFTLGAARAVGEEASRGKLELGYRADLTVLDVDPLRCEARELLLARVLLTVINGEIAWQP